MPVKGALRCKYHRITAQENGNEMGIQVEMVECVDMVVSICTSDVVGDAPSFNGKDFRSR